MDWTVQGSRQASLCDYNFYDSNSWKEPKAAHKLAVGYLSSLLGLYLANISCNYNVIQDL